MYTFHSLSDYLRENPSVKNGTAVCVITGDIFHHKARLDSFCVTLFHELVRTISSLLPLYIIKGNHDLQRDKAEVPDLIEAVLNVDATSNNTYYIKHTGHYIIGDVGFGYCDVEDTLLPGTSSGKQVEELPVFPDPAEFQKHTHVKMKCALFHGTVISAKLQNYTDSSTGYPLEWFKGYDLALLGDVHLQQVNNVSSNGAWLDNQLIWGYPGSLVQQNFGEELINHGLLEWDLNSKVCHKRNINQEYGLVKLRLNDSEQNLLRRWTVSNYGNAFLMDLLDNPLCPNKLKLRLYNNPDISDISQLKSLLSEREIEHEINSLCSYQNENCNEIDQKKILDSSTPHDWIQFMSKSVNDKKMHPDWKQWILNPKEMAFPLHESLSDFTKDKISKKNVEFDTSCLSFNSLQESSTTQTTLFTISYIEWSWLLCFKENCWLNFNDMNSLVNMISGKNGTGKTSILEIIVIALFGECTPSKTNHSCSSSMVNRQKPPDSKAQSTLVFDLNGISYKIHRAFRINSKDPEKLKDIETTITSAALPFPLSGNKTTNEWIRNNLCDVEHFLQNVLISQTENLDFFQMSDKKQIQTIEKSQNIDTIYQFIDLIDQAIKSHSHFYATLRESQENDINNKLSTIDYTEIEKNKASLINAEKDLTKINLEYSDLVSLSHKWGHVKDADFDIDINSKISELNKKLEDIHVDYSLDELYIKKGHHEYIEHEIAKLKHIQPSGNLEHSKQFVTKFDKEILLHKKLTKTLQNLRQEEDSLKHDYNDLLKNISALKDSLPDKPTIPLASIINTVKKLENLIAKKVSIERNITKLEKFLSHHEHLCNSIREKSQEIDDLKARCAEIQNFDHPFNPECSACNSQLWKIELNSLSRKLVQAKSDHVNLEHSLENYLKSRSISDKKIALQKNLDYLDFINSNDLSDLMKKKLQAEQFFQTMKIIDEENKKIISFENSLQELQLEISELHIKLQNIDISENRQELYAEHTLFIDIVSRWGDISAIGKIDSLIQLVKSKQDIENDLSYWHTCLDFKSKRDRLLLLKSRENTLTSQITDLQNSLTKTNLLILENEALLDKGRFIDEIDLRLETLQHVSRMFTQYRKVMLNEYILPFLIDKVNSILSIISENSTLYISAEHLSISAKANSKTKFKDVIKWSMHCDGSSLPIEKASGFQRFMISFGMRVVMNNINTKLKNAQLFIDEGFTTFDHDHLFKVSTMLNSLKNDYRQILLVSHLEELQNNIHSKLEISRQNGQSSIQFGEKIPHFEFAPKKKGRKKKTYIDEPSSSLDQ